MGEEDQLRVAITIMFIMRKRFQHLNSFPLHILTHVILISRVPNDFNASTVIITEVREPEWKKSLIMHISTIGQHITGQNTRMHETVGHILTSHQFSGASIIVLRMQWMKLYIY